MCITVEKTHLKLLAKKLNGVVAELRREAPTRATEFLLSVDPGYAEATIIFRDFPKRHGNIISAAVKLALDGHVGGLSQSEKNFTFLSGAKVAVDNFFLSSTGRIYLFETRRDFSKVRLDAQKS